MPLLLLALGAALASHALLGLTSMAGRSPTFPVLAAHGVVVTMVLLLALGLASGLAPFAPPGWGPALAIVAAGALARAAECLPNRHGALHRLLSPAMPLLAPQAMVLAGALYGGAGATPALPGGVAAAAIVGGTYAGALLALGAFAERLEESPLPRRLRGFPALVIGAAIVGIAILGLARTTA